MRGATPPPSADQAAPAPVKSGALSVSLAGARPHPEISAERPLPGKSHYLVGNDPAKHHTDIPTYGAVRYREVYPGVDWVLYGNPQTLEYDFVVAPGADPKQIRLDYLGAESIQLNHQGDLVLTLAGGQIVQKKPIVYQDIAGERRSVEGRYRIEPNRQVAFELAAYDARQPLVIDPVLFYSTYLGGDDSDTAKAIAVDSAGSAYVAGETSSTDFNAVNPVEGDSVNVDAFIAKLSPDGDSLVYSTYLGGSSIDIARAIAVDSAGSAYVAGHTDSTDFDTVNPIEGDSAGTDAFIAKLSVAGNSLIYSTYLGGSSSDNAFAIAVDSA
ncbi:MAG: SBBP repeat-containing protein, partial [Solimonas sp.]